MFVLSGRSSRFLTALSTGALGLGVLVAPGPSAAAPPMVSDARDHGWSPILTVGRAPVSVPHADVAIDVAGAAVALWQDSTRARHLVRAGALGADGAWGDAVDVAEGFGLPMKVGVGDGGHAAAIWIRDNHTWIASRAPDGGWREPTRVGRLAGVKDLSENAAVVLPDGTALLGWSRRTWGHERETHVTRLAPDGTVAADDIVNGGYEGGPPSLALGDDGTVTSMWVERSSPGAPGLLTSRTWSAEGGWSRPLRADGAGRRYLELRVVATRQGGVSAAWLERDRRWLVVADRAEAGFERQLQLRVRSDRPRLREIHTFSHAAGRLLLGWTQRLVGADATRHTLAVRIPAGEWTRNRVVTVDTTSSTMSADITRRGRVVAAWTEPIDRAYARVRAMDRTVRGRWTDRYHVGWGLDPQVEQNAVGDAVVTWRSSRDGERNHTEVLLSRARPS